MFQYLPYFQNELMSTITDRLAAINEQLQELKDHRKIFYVRFYLKASIWPSPDVFRRTPKVKLRGLSVAHLKSLASDPLWWSCLPRQSIITPTRPLRTGQYVTLKNINMLRRDWRKPCLSFIGKLCVRSPHEIMRWGLTWFEEDWSYWRTIG